MRNRGPILIVLSIITVFLTANSVSAEAVAVGDSVLIETLDYSDTFTLEANGGLAGRVEGSVYSGDAAFAVENNYGNPASAWPSIITPDYDELKFTGAKLDGDDDSGAGSDTGTVAMDPAARSKWTDYGFAYGLRNRFVLQYDVAMPGDRADFIISLTQPDGHNVINESGAFSVFFRKDKITLKADGYAKDYREWQIPGLEPNLSVGEWYNLAVLLDLDARTVQCFINESPVEDNNGMSVFNIDNVVLEVGKNGDFKDLELHNDFVGFGVSTFGGAAHVDNFQVGAAVPEPGILVLLAGGLMLFVARRRRE